MLSIYLFFLAFKIIATVTCAVLTFRIARTHLVPSYTYVLFSMAFTLRFFTQLQSLWYSGTILGLLNQFSYAIIITSQMIEATIIGLFLIGFLRKWQAVRHLTAINKGTQ